MKSLRRRRRRRREARRWRRRKRRRIDLYKERKYRFFIISFYSVNQTRWLCWKNIRRRYTCITIHLIPQVSPDLKNYIHLVNGTESTNSVNTKLESGCRTESSIPCKDRSDDRKIELI
jgi:hypothetical protein